MPRKRPFKYTLTDVITEYNKDLYNEIVARIPIKLVKDTINGWTPKIKDNLAIITYDKTESPDACFAHELLHIKYELDGLKRPKIIDNEGVADIMGLLFNHFCHFKFYKEFYDIGFIEEEFLSDKDQKETEKTINYSLLELEKFFNTSGRIKPSTALLIPYMVLKSPHDKSAITKSQIERLIKIGDKDFFNKLDKIISDWTESATLDTSYTFAKIFKACNRPNVGFCISGQKEDLIVAGDITED
jgi:hypothetical protein